MGNVAENGAWGLDPWTDEITFVPVADDAPPVWMVPKPVERPWWPGCPADFDVTYGMLRAKEYASPALAWRGFVYVAEGDEERLLAALKAIERFLRLMALAAGGAP